jgi:hypothetical protein
MDNWIPGQSENPSGRPRRLSANPMVQPLARATGCERAEFSDDPLPLLEGQAGKTGYTRLERLKHSSS